MLHSLNRRVSILRQIDFSQRQFAEQRKLLPDGSPLRRNTITFDELRYGFITERITNE